MNPRLFVLKICPQPKIQKPKPQPQNNNPKLQRQIYLGRILLLPVLPPRQKHGDKAYMLMHLWGLSPNMTWHRYSSVNYERQDVSEKNNVCIIHDLSLLPGTKLNISKN